MGQNAHIGRAKRALISIDGVLLAIALIVMLFCVSAFIRITSDAQTAPLGGAHLALTSADDLLAFEDFTFGSEAWSPAGITARLQGLGPVLGPFTGDVVERAFHVPVGASDVRLRFDVHLHGDWAVGDVLRLSTGGQGGVAIAVMARDEAEVELSVTLDDADFDVDIRQQLIQPRLPETALPGVEASPILSLTVSLRMQPSGDTIPLSLVAELSEGAAWSLDNLAVVARTTGEG